MLTLDDRVVDSGNLMMQELIAFLTQPIVAFCLGAAGTLLTAYGLVKRDRARCFSYRVSDLVSWRDQEACTRLVFWNGGRDAIRANDIGEQLAITTAPDATPTAARIVTTSNAGAKIVATVKAGQVLIGLSYLNRYDGAVIDVTFAGRNGLSSKIDRDVTMTGDIIGGGAPSRKDPGLVIVGFHLSMLMLSWAIILVGNSSDNPIMHWPLMIIGGFLYPLCVVRYRHYMIRHRVPGFLADIFAEPPGAIERVG
jgi:hypothetical protein